MQKHKILSFLLSFVAAMALWVYAVTVINPDDVTSIRGVRVRLVGTNELQMSHLILTGGEEQVVDVEIAGRRSDLKELNSSTLEVVADVSKIDGPGVYELSWTLDPPSTVASGDIKLVSSSANKIKVRVSEYKERPEIPIRISYEGALAEGFVRDPAVTSLESLSVSGPAEEVERILYARVRVDLKDTKVSLDEELPYELVSKDDEILTMSDYVTVNEPTVRVMVPVFFYKQIKLELDIVEGAGAKKENVSFTIDPPVIGVVGDEATLRAMDDTLVIRQFRLAEITETVDLTVIPELPGGVINRGTDNSVVIHLELVDLFTKTFYISPADIHRENDNGTLDFGVSRIPVIVRGNAKQIISLTADMLSVSADMTNDYDDTTKTVKLKVLLPVQSGCGVLGEYSVPVVEKIPETVPDETTGEG